MASNPDNLQGLLRWGLANQTPEQVEAVDPIRSKEHMKILNDIMANQVSDAQRMRAAVAIAGDSSIPLEERLIAWDELEMLIESLDNANDLTPLKLWPDIIAHFRDSEPETVTQALWVCGTAIQNNPKSQEDFLAENPIPTIIELIAETSTSAQVRSKALYCLSGAVKHNESAMSTFTSNQGWQALNSALQDPDITCRRKSAFLIDSLFQHSTTPSQLVQSARESKTIDTLVSCLGKDMLPFGPNGEESEDEDLEDKAFGAIKTMIDVCGKESLSEAEREEVGQALAKKDFGLTEQEKRDFLNKLM